ASASRAAVCPDHSTQRGRSSSSARQISAATQGTVHELAPAASPSSSAGDMTSATRSPRLTPAWRNEVTRSAPATDPPCHERTAATGARHPGLDLYSVAHAQGRLHLGQGGRRDIVGPLVAGSQHLAHVAE